MNHSKKWSKKAISMALVAAMVGTSVMPTFAASTDRNASAKREATNADNIPEGSYTGYGSSGEQQ